MSLAAKCICGKSAYYCNGNEECVNKVNISFQQFVSKNNCTDEEVKQLRAFLFALRHNDVDVIFLERIIAKYQDLLY